MEPAKTATTIHLKRALFVEWQGAAPPPSRLENSLGLEIVVGEKSFFISLSHGVSLEERCGLVVSRVTKTKLIPRQKMILSRKELKVMQIFEKAVDQNGAINRPIAIALPPKIQHYAYYIRFACQKGVLTARIDPKPVRPVFIAISFFLFDAMNGSYEGILTPAPQFNYNEALMTAAFERCCESHLSKKELQSFIQKLDTFFPSLQMHGAKATPPILKLCYETLGKENMRTLMQFLTRTNYPVINVPKMEQTFPRAFSLFACLFDPTEMRAENMTKMGQVFFTRLIGKKPPAT